MKSHPLTNVLPFFFRILREMKYIPELAYHGLYLLCSPLHREGDKVKETGPELPVELEAYGS